METAPTVLIRRGRKEDEPYIRAFTRNTFEWGDYVGDAFAGWLDGHHDVYVAEAGGVPVAVTCVAILLKAKHGSKASASIRITGGWVSPAANRGIHSRRKSTRRARLQVQHRFGQREITGPCQVDGFRQVARIIDYVVSASETGEHAPQLAVE